MSRVSANDAESNPLAKEFADGFYARLQASINHFKEKRGVENPLQYEELASELGRIIGEPPVSVASISRWLTFNGMPENYRAVGLAEFLGVHPAWLILGDMDVAPAWYTARIKAEAEALARTQRVIEKGTSPSSGRTRRRRKPPPRRQGKG